MPGVEITGGLDDQLKRLQGRAQRASRELANSSKPYAEMSAFLDRWVQKNFQTEGGKVGGWAPFKHGGRVSGKPTPGATPVELVVAFSSSVVTFSGFLDRSAKLLRDTGALRLSYRPFFNTNDAGIGSDLPYSKAHNDGIGVPARRQLPEESDVDEESRMMLANEIESIAKKHELGKVRFSDSGVVQRP